MSALVVSRGSTCCVKDRKQRLFLGGQVDLFGYNHKEAERVHVETLHPSVSQNGLRAAYAEGRLCVFVCYLSLSGLLIIAE